MKSPAHVFWAFFNWYGAVFGRPSLSPLHRFFLNLSLHGLGYDNARHTGEEWFISHILSQSDIQICIDVGANVGAYSTLLAQHLRDAVIYAIEPSTSSFVELEKIAAHYPGQIIPVKAAISDKEGIATLFSRAERSEKASLDLTPGENTPLCEEVRTVTLDALAKEQSIERVDFIKIDTEGHEHEVFIGMQETLSRLRPQFIQFEFNHVHLYRDTTLYALSQLLPGYEFYRLLPHGWTPIDPSKQANNIFMFSNMVAKRIL